VSEEKFSMDRQNPDLKPSAKSAFFSLFSAGVTGWFVGLIITLGIGWIKFHPDSAYSAAIWAISHGWAGFLFGLVTLVAYGIIKRLPLGPAAFAFVLPVAMLALLSGVCLLIYPDSFLREELFTYLPMVFVFYVFGLLWIKFRKEEAESIPMSRTLVPAVVGGLMILGFVAVPVFASNAFRYRDAFNLTVSKTSLRDGAIYVEGKIEIRKAGNYRFSAPRYIWPTPDNPDMTEPELELGEINWGGSGFPQTGALGIFPLQIVWRKGTPLKSLSELALLDDLVSIDVRNPDEGDQVVTSISAPLRNDSELPVGGTGEDR
jgi:hypothetical protein